MNKKGLEFETLGTWILALIGLGIILLGIMLLQGKGTSLIDKFMEFMRFGR